MARPRSDQNLCVRVGLAVGVCALSVCVSVLTGVRAMSVCDVVDLVCFLLIGCVFELAVRVEVFILVFLARVRQVFVCQILLRVGVCARLLCTRVGDLINPAPEAADACVERGRGRVAAAVAPGDDPGEDPATRLFLTHQAASGVALTTVVVEEAGVGRAASAQGAVAGEAVAIALLTLP